MYTSWKIWKITFIFQVLEMSWNFTKLGNVLEKILPVKKFTENNKASEKILCLNCRGKLQL